MLTIPAIIEEVKTSKDGGLLLKVETQELTPETKAEVMKYHNKFGYFIFAEETEQVKEEDIPTEQLEFPEQKSQAQRLRAVLYRLFEKNPLGYTDFELYYRYQTEKMIEKIKDKLN